MKIPMPFPKCKSCGESSPKSFHSYNNCGGRMLIETDNDEVYCQKCPMHWNVWDSEYHCTCGSVFKAYEVRRTLVEVLASCKACADEMRMQNKYKGARDDLTSVSIRAFITKMFEQIGYSFGVSIGTLIESALAFFGKQ